MADALTPPPQSPIQGAVSNANQLVSEHPWMVQQSPEILADGIAGNATPQNMDILDHSSKVVAVGDAIAQHQDVNNSHSIWATALGGVTGFASTVVHKMSADIPGFKTVSGWANAGMQEMQKDFKFIGAIYKDRGIGEGLLATAGIGAGAILGTALGPEGTVAGAALTTGLFATIGADIAGVGERQILGRVIPDFKLPMRQSNDPLFIMNPGHVVATGLSNLTGWKSLADTSKGWGQTISGLTDMGFDFKTDPLLALGKFTGAVKSGGLLTGVAKDGVQVGVRINSPLASSAPAISDWLVKNSGVQWTSDGVQQVYEAGKGIVNGGLLGKVGYAMNPFTGASRNFYRAVDTITKETNPVAIQAMFPGSQFSVATAQRLAAATKPEEVVSTIADSLHVRELLQNGDLQGKANRLVLPTQALPRLINGKITDAIIQKADDPTLDMTSNLLLPKKIAVKNADGEYLDVNGGIAKDTKEPKAYQRLGGGLYSKGADGTYNIWNPLAGKIRTFTGYKSLSVNPIIMEQSADKIDWQSPDAFTALYNMARYTMGKKAALEATSNVMKFKGNDALLNVQYGQLIKEMAKGAGLTEDTQVVKNVMSQIQRATASGQNELHAYGSTVAGITTPGTQMRETMDANGNIVPGTIEQVALNESQLGGGAIINFKQLRKAIQEANAYNRMYAKGDDFFTWYTEKAFAPLTLFTTGFGMRVAAGEAIHQVMRKGASSYLQNVVIANGLRYDRDLITNAATRDAVIKLRANALVDGATAEDIGRTAGLDHTVIENEMTKFIGEKEGMWDKLKLPRPVGYVSSKMVPYVAKDKLAVISNYQQLMDIILPSSMTATHLAKLASATEEEVNTLAQLMRGTVKGKNPLQMFDYVHPSYHGYWATQVNNWSKSAFGKDIAQDYINLSANARFRKLSTDARWLKVQKLHEDRLNDLTKYADLRNRFVGLSSGDLGSFATNQVQSLRGLVEGADMTTHTNLINNIAKGEKTYVDDLRKIQADQSPKVMIGRVAPDISGNIFDKVIDAGHRNIIGPIIDHVSREPIFNHYLYENYRAYKPAIDSGALSEDEALRLSGQAAVGNILPMIHNPALRSQMAMIHRNLLPFYFAQEQSIKRVGRLITTNPQALREFQMIQQGINNPGFVHTDANGQQYIIYPVLGEFGNAVSRGLDALGLQQYVGLPTSVTGNMSSLLSVLPESKMPSVNPFANVAVSQLSNVFPNFMGLAKISNRVANLATGANPFDSKSSGYMSKGILDAMIPNSTIRDLFNALNMDQKESMVANAMQSAIAAAYASGQLNKEDYQNMTPAEQQAVMDRIQNNARTNLLVKGMLAFFLPLSPAVSNDYYNKAGQSLRAEWLHLTLPKTGGGLGMTFPEATLKFSEEHGTDAMSYSVSSTVSGSGGSSVPLADEVLTWLDTNKKTMETHPYAAAYLVPQVQASPDALKVEQTLLTMHLREQRTPQEFLTAIYTQKGWNDIQPSLADYQDLVSKAKAAGNSHQVSALVSAWKTYTAKFGLQNPIWYADYNNPTKSTSAMTALGQLQDLKAKGQLGSSNVAPGIDRLLASYDDYHAVLQANTYDNGSKYNHAYSAYKSAWSDYLNQLALDHKELTNVITGVFKKVV